jgi:hypothetical protein
MQGPPVRAQTPFAVARTPFELAQMPFAGRLLAFVGRLLAFVRPTSAARRSYNDLIFNDLTGKPVPGRQNRPIQAISGPSPDATLLDRRSDPFASFHAAPL